MIDDDFDYIKLFKQRHKPLYVIGWKFTVIFIFKLIKYVFFVIDLNGSYVEVDDFDRYIDGLDKGCTKYFLIII